MPRAWPPPPASVYSQARYTTENGCVSGTVDSHRGDMPKAQARRRNARRVSLQRLQKAVFPSLNNQPSLKVPVIGSVTTLKGTVTNKSRIY